MPPVAPARKVSTERVLGHDIPKVRPTGAGVFWCCVYLGVPVAILGNALDFLAQILLGWCIGFWCVI